MCDIELVITEGAAMTKKKIRSYEAGEYVEAIGSGPSRKDITLIPITIAAAALDVMPTTARAYVRQGILKEVAVVCGDATVKGVTLGSLHAELKKRSDRVSELVDDLETILWNEGGRPMEYGEVMPRVGLSTSNPHHRSLMGAALGQLSEASFKSHGFMISSIVVLKSNGRPNPSFFDLAHAIGAKKRSMGDERFWQEDRQRIRDHFGPQEWDEGFEEVDE